MFQFFDSVYIHEEILANQMSVYGQHIIEMLLQLSINPFWSKKRSIFFILLLLPTLTISIFGAYYTELFCKTIIDLST